MYLEEGNRTLAACKAMHKRLRQQNKKGEALRQQFDDGTKKDAADVVRFRAEAECHCQESESIRNDKSVEALLAAFRQQCHSGTRGLPAFSVSGLYISIETSKGEVRLKPIFLSRESLNATIAAAQSFGTLSSRQPRHLRRACTRKGIEAGFVSVFARSLAKLGIAVSSGGGSSSPAVGNQSDEEEPSEANELLSEMGMGRKGPNVGRVGLLGTLLGVGGTVALGSASLLAATWQAAGDYTDNVLFRTGISKKLPHFEMPLSIKAHLLQDYVRECGRWNSRHWRQKANEGSSADDTWGQEDVQQVVASAALAAMALVEKLTTDEAKQQLRQIVELIDSVPLGGHQDSSVDAGSLTLDSPAEGLPQHSGPPTDADDEDDDDDDEHTAKLKIHYTPAEAFGMVPTEGVWDDVKEPDHLKGIIVVGDCGLRNTSASLPRHKQYPIGVGDAAVFAAEASVRTNDED